MPRVLPATTRGLGGLLRRGRRNRSQRLNDRGIPTGVLAHEIGHAWYGHDWRNPHDEGRDERQANLYAARLLLSPIEYAIAEALHHHPGAIAKELGISQYLVELWQTQLQRV